MELSIIIPTYNEEKHLPRLLDSIKRQEFKDYEIIIADANSKDKTREIAKKHGCIVVEGGLPSKGRNNGANAARGKFLLFLDADIVIPPDYLKESLREFKERDLGIAISKVTPISSKIIDKFLYSIANMFFTAMEKIKPHGAGFCGILTKKSLHTSIGCFDESITYSEDAYYIEKIGRSSKFGVLRNSNIFLSVRRLDKEGRLNFVLKNLKGTFYQFIKKQVTLKDMDYDFEYD
jgi:glycosyltransferase involved in cell wall biosynthesis